MGGEEPVHLLRGGLSRRRLQESDQREDLRYIPITEPPATTTPQWEERGINHDLHSGVSTATRTDAHRATVRLEMDKKQKRIVCR
ncbi:hypothetical protein DPEC_G00275210 [Dallia pectoralis]|uniref:Uncharacterized protein n=1 Tax=Dallia pectoralis TaxID=75939 RepID=A0ACC2FLC1_DALPE|nr:hypothetical protein DPEC_G00275210 [Dallia pectoralis]